MLQAVVQFTKEVKLPCSLILLHTIHTVLIGVQETHLVLVPSTEEALDLLVSQDLVASITAVATLEVPHG